MRAKAKHAYTAVLSLFISIVVPWFGGLSEQLETLLFKLLFLHVETCRGNVAVKQVSGSITQMVIALFRLILESLGCVNSRTRGSKE